MKYIKSDICILDKKNFSVSVALKFTLILKIKKILVNLIFHTF